MPVVRTAANKVQRFFAGVPGAFALGAVAPPPFNPNTQVWLIDPPVFDNPANPTKVLVCEPPVAPAPGGAVQYYFVPPASLHMAWLANQPAVGGGGDLLTGMKYGAYKALEGTEMSRPNAQYNPGEQVPRVNPTLLNPGVAGACLYCGNAWGDHKINESNDVRNLALQIGGPAPGLNLAAQKMLGVLKVVRPGVAAPDYFCAISGPDGMVQQGLENALAAGLLAAAAPLNLIRVARSLGAHFQLRDFSLAVIANWAAVVNNSAQTPAARNAIDTPDDLSCAAPKLLQRAFEYYDQNHLPLAGATMYLSEVSFLPASNKYEVQHSAASCNKCRLSCWRFLCNYVNVHKKALPANARPAGHQSLTGRLGANRLR